MKLKIIGIDVKHTNIVNYFYLILPLCILNIILCDNDHDLCTKNDIWSTSPRNHELLKYNRLRNSSSNYTFHFTRKLYNVTIPENSMGKTYVSPTCPEERIGIEIPNNCEDVSFRIISGDRDKLFKAEERTVGNFAFLAVRIKTNNVVLNREKNDQYVLKIKSSIVCLQEHRQKMSYSAECIMHVQVLDRNDLSPLFYPTEYVSTISEDIPMHTSIVKVTAEDADLGMNGEIYYYLLNENDFFSIHPSSGEITNIRSLIDIGSEIIELIVIATDRGSVLNHNSLQSSKAKVVIQIKKANLHSPEMYITAVTRAFRHETPDMKSNIFGIIKLTDKDKGRHGEINRVLIVSGDPDGHFHIVPSDVNGVFYLQLKQLAKVFKTTSFNLTIRADDNGIPSKHVVQNMTLSIFADENNGPIFSKQIYEVSIPETAPPNMPVIRLKVTDPDLEKNAQVFLEIVGGNEGAEFKINPDSGMLYTHKSLDAETKSIYTLTVSAIDQASFGVRKQSSAKVKINILDVNDNDPIFEVINTTVSLKENELAGTVVTKVSAKDKDSGENSYISYSISNLNDVPFDIDNFSGVIRTSIVIDYETMQRNYKLRIRASDWGLPFRRQSEMEISIEIVDVNDNRPQFERINCIGKILRQASVGTEVFRLSAIDFDAGDYITYRLTSGNEDDCFNLDPTSGIITIGCDLSDVRASNRALNVTATDGLHFSDEMTIQINLLDSSHQYEPISRYSNEDISGYSSFECQETGVSKKLADILATLEKNMNTEENINADENFLLLNRYGQNFNRPEFLNFPLILKINESLPLGETITWFKGKDRDLGYNGKLIYAISDGDLDSVFRVDMETGEMQLIGYLDRERQDEYILNITICDLGVPQKCNSKMLAVTILDSNDNVPVFQRPLVQFHLREDVANGTMIYCLNATDADIGKNADVFFVMKTSTGKFDINSTTGCIFLVDELDREEKDNYELRVIAKDNGLPSLSAEAIVLIIVDDVNDCPPTFGVQEIILKIREDIPKGTVVASVGASDFDLGLNGKILFSLINDNMNYSMFRIDEYSGVIRTQGYLDYENQPMYNLMVVAKDCGTPSLSSTMPVVIQVIDVNENRYAPEFDDFVYIGRIKENEPRGSIVMNVTAKDFDEQGSDSEVSYFIRGGDGLGTFSVNNKGFIRTVSHLDAETKNFYWLTLCAQDQAIVPLVSCVQIYIEVENVNDNVPMTDYPVYYPTILEGSNASTRILKLNATDDDIDNTTILTYKIVSGNPEGFFELNKLTGELITTERKLDRENQAEHILEVHISDNGTPNLFSTTRVIVNVLDVNDNSPQFDQRFYKVQVPSTALTGTSIFQVHATDSDDNENGRISYSIKSGKGKNKFKIESDTGAIFLSKTLERDGEYELIIKAEDNGIVKRSQTARLNVVVVPIVELSPYPPKIKNMESMVEVTESDRPGFLVTLIQATDEDNDSLWYNISDGNDRNGFYIGHDNGNILLAKFLDWETKNFYNLTISVTDGTHTVKTHLYVRVVDTNDNRPEFTKDIYQVNISESIKEESTIMQLHATDRDEDTKVFYTLHGSKDPSSLRFFRIDSITGNVIVTQSLDFEKSKQHVLTVIAKDQGTPAKRNYAKIVILVHDHNDHHPEFTSKIIQSKIPESTAIGSKVVQLNAIDRDSGKNGEIMYSITSGNVGHTFEVDNNLGIIKLAQNLNIMQIQEYMLHIKATDCGEPSLASQIPVHIIVVMADNDPPKFTMHSPSIEIFENLPVGTYVTHVDTRCTSSVFYDIIKGNDDDCFYINPSTGVILINSIVDYEKQKNFNITIKATNMAAISSHYNFTIHILDVNDNSPLFLETEYYGQISEGAEIGSFVTSNDTHKSLIFLNVVDADAGQNSVLEFTITDELAAKHFEIDSSTGAIQVLQKLDYELKSSFKFNVMVNDKGHPKLYSPILAAVTIAVLNVNDCPPVFEEKVNNFTLYLPTFEGVEVAQVVATDLDKDANSEIRYDIVDGNINNSFNIQNFSGIITLRNIQDMNSLYTLYIRASDGLFSTLTEINIYTVFIENPLFSFQKPKYEFSTIENSTKIAIVGIVNVIGSLLFENIEYRILNPSNYFEMGKSSGAIKTTGFAFDRELIEKYILIVEGISKLYDGNREHIRRAVTQVEIQILDVNDNCPMFVNLPYFATVSLDDLKGSVIIQVKAIDMDSFENGEVRYEMKRGNGELFKVDRKTGEIILKQYIDSNEKSFDITVAAYDNALMPCYAEIPVSIKVVDKSMPVFSKQFYSDVIREDVEIYSAISVKIHAESPLQRKLIYTITSGNEAEQFEIDYRTGVLYVVNNLDFEKQRSHELVVSATDSISGVTAEVTVSVGVQDANDCYPEIDQNNYNITIPENILLGSQILKINATDCDFGANSILSYEIESINGETESKLFYIDVADGSLYLKHQLDYEECKLYFIIICVKDHGTPSLQTKANVWIKVSDLNDNIPKFVEPSFTTKLSVEATRGQFVMRAKGYDSDDCDANSLKYKIVDGNEQQVFTIQDNTGIITLQNSKRLRNNKQSLLNISVTDGVHTSFARVKISLLPENIHSPIFKKNIYQAHIRENESSEQEVITVKATDEDFGKYSAISYEIIGDDMKVLFKIDKETGSIFTSATFDREKQSFYEILIKATDGGGKFGYTLVKVKVEDENDNSPLFNFNELTVTLKADLQVPATVAKIIATDLDLGVNGMINYTIESETIDPIYLSYLTLSSKGDLIIIKSLHDISNDTIQFFIRATDTAISNKLFSNLAVTIQIINTNVSMPSFEKDSININVQESLIPGTVLTKLKISGNYSVKYSLISASPKFSISENGEVILMQYLNREETSIEHLIAMAETITMPVFYTYLSIFINVKDENDNYPKFSSKVYSINVPENMPKGTAIMKITAIDIDEGPNSDIRYFLEDEKYASIFEIDIYTGWITLLTELDRELKSEYYFNVYAADNGQPKQISKVPIVVNVIDCNDNPPIFKDEQKVVSVAENALSGTVITSFVVSDLDSEKMNIEYIILSGDNYSQFQISNNGELFVLRGLDREFIPAYNISVAVTDGKFVSYANVIINIEDVNDNFPICIIPRYKIDVNESFPINGSLIEINAIDYDDTANNKIRYYLTGNFSDHFYMDNDAGVLKLGKTLDREIFPKYKILVHVQDGKELSQECTCEAIIIVHDVNDNAPQFSLPSYIASIPEDAPIQTIVTKVHAIDKDFGLNRRIEYSFKDGRNDFFEINPYTGIIKLIKNLDRENISTFNTSIKAKDLGNPAMYSIAHLVVHVLDINDNPPEFILKQYNAFLLENAAINTEVIRISATSKDIGINAEISYYIVGGNEQQKFKIDEKTGILYLNAEVDYEKTKAFFLTIQAIDGGSPPLSNQVYTNITILDVNDNKPQFSQNIYRIRVSEDAKKGQNVIRISATDEDDKDNAVVSYNIERGDRLNQFAINENNGNIYVNNSLDRENMSSYILEIRACDKGVPLLCSFVQVYIDILDVNDNPPRFKNSNYSFIVQENKPLDYVITTFEVDDADDFPNSGPFTFDFRSGNEGGVFRLEQDGSLRSATRFNHRICHQYILQIRVFDNGIPPLFSDTWINLNIIEESQYPPIITPLEITINSYDDNFSGGFLGKLFVSDQDKYDTFSFNIAPAAGEVYSTLNIFNISRQTGEIYAIQNLDVGLYQINVTVSDGKYVSHAIVRVNVELITDDMIKNSAILKFAKISPKDFILSRRKVFIRSLREIFRCRQNDIIIIAINHSESSRFASEFGNEISNNNNTTSIASQDSKNFISIPYSTIELIISIRKQQIIPNSDYYYSSEEIRNVISKNIELIEDRANILIEELVTTECPRNICMPFGQCKIQLNLNKNKVQTFNSDVVSYITPTYSLNNMCICKQGFAGRFCDETINACSSDPCSAQKQCWPADTLSGYQCICPTGYSGHFCEIKSTKCENDNCSNFQTSVSFAGKSYAHYKINKSVARNIIESQFSISLKIRTVQQSATLLYASGKIDYNIIEIINGALQYRFDLGSGEGTVVVSSVNITDGKWHYLKLERILNTAKLTIDNKHSSQGSAPGVNLILNLQANDIFLGAEVKPHSTIIGYEDIRRGFIGCMTDIRIAQETLPLYISGGSTIVALKRFTNVEFSCDPAKVLVNLGICGAQPCLNSGHCKDNGDTFQCICSERFTGKVCEIDLDPCASSPCLYGGICEFLSPNNYTCKCPIHLSGKRCEYGRFCSPNPCKNGGICEEGDGIPHCTCRGFTGTTCEIDVDECGNQPCGRGATCINEAGSFRCICPSYLTGASCGDPLYSNSISTKLKNFSIENITVIVCGLVLVFILFVLTLCCIIYKKSSKTNRKHSSQRIKNTYKGANLNSILDKEKTNNKHIVKLSNLEMNQRPISYTPSSTDNAMFTANTHFVNNLDILRSYGSAGEELENIPFEYQKIHLNNQNVNINNENISEVCSSSYKREWNDQMHLKTFCENKLNNEAAMDFNMPLNTIKSIKPTFGKLLQVKMPNICQTSYSGEYSSHPQYHWDCSDWARNSQNPLPDITEVPGAEIADSSSFHSNESNESKPKLTLMTKSSVLKVNPARDIETLDEEIISDSMDSKAQDCIEHFSDPISNNSLPRLTPIYCSENEDYKSNSGKMYLRHPDSYLPPLHNLSETEAENSLLMSSNDNLDASRRKISGTSEKIYLYGGNSCGSNLSVHLCEIEDSELEEFLPKGETTKRDNI